MNLKDIKPLALLKGYLIKIFPFLGYKGVVSYQLRIYRKLKRMNRHALKKWSKTAPPVTGIENLMDGKNIRSDLIVEDIEKFRAKNRSSGFTAPYSEEVILNMMLIARGQFNAKDPGATEYFLDLTELPNKTLEQTIMAILEWEYLSNMRAYTIRGEHNIPTEFIERFRKEMSEYVHRRVKARS